MRVRKVAFPFLMTCVVTLAAEYNPLITALKPQGQQLSKQVVAIQPGDQGQVGQQRTLLLGLGLLLLGGALPGRIGISGRKNCAAGDLLYDHALSNLRSYGSGLGFRGGYGGYEGVYGGVYDSGYPGAFGGGYAGFRRGFGNGYGREHGSGYVLIGG